MPERGRDIVPGQPRNFLSPSLRRAGSRPLSDLLLIGLTALGWIWATFAGHALWQFAANVDGLLALATRPHVTHQDSFEAPLVPSVLPAPQTPEGQLDPDMFHRGSMDPLQESGEQHSGKPTAVESPPALAYHGATCSGVFVYIVTISEQSPRHSAVSFATKDTARSSFARPGQAVGPWEVLAITDDWTGTNPVVWLTRDDEVCRTGLTGNPIRARMARDKQRKKRKSKRRRR
jgi:hypothetical protein